MRACIRNEIRLFYSRKNIAICLLGIVGMILAYYFHYVPTYQNYPDTKLQELNENSRDITIWLAEYEYEYTLLSRDTESSQGADELEQLFGEGQLTEESQEVYGFGVADLLQDRWTTSSELEKVELLRDTWKKYEQSNIRLMYYWSGDVDEKGIRTAMIGEDRNLTAIEELAEEIEETNIFRGSISDWQKRMLLHDAYEEAGVAEPICPVVPSGCYLLQDAFSGSSVVSWIFLIMAMLLNYDCWANEFEYHTYMQLYTLPMRKEKLYVVRTVVRSLCSVLHICAAGTVLFVLGTVNYGMGKELLAVVATGTQYAVMPIASIVTKEILFAMLYLVFVVIFTIGLSFLLKTKMNTLMVCTVTCMTGIVHVSSYRTVGWEMNLTECMNPFNLQRAGEIVTGEMGMDGKYMLFLLLYILLLVMVGILGICFRED